MTGSLDELGEFGRGDNGFVAVMLVPQFVDGDRAAVPGDRCAVENQCAALMQKNAKR